MSGSGRERRPSPEREADRRHRTLFRACLRILPRSFRATYGADMAELFEVRVGRARRTGGRRAILSLWARSLGDVTRTAVALRWSGGEGNEPRRGRGRGDSRRGGTMDRWLQDVRYAARRLTHTPGFTLAAVAILMVGIGANVAAFSVVDTVLFRPLPGERPEDVVTILQDSDDGEPSSTSFPAYRDMATHDEVFTAVAATSPDGVTWEREDGPRDASVEYVTASYLDVLGLAPSLGRWFSPEHDQPGAGAFAVVSHRTWRSAMGGDPGVVGTTVRLNGQPVTIVGVGPAAYNGPGGSLVTDFWLSISSTFVGGSFRVSNLERRQDHWYQVKARLAPGVTVERARAAMDGLALRLGEEFPELNRGRGITVFAHDELRLHPRLDGPLFALGAGLLAVVGLVLILACSNLANLLLVRGLVRGPEVAVRQALGASRARVARLFFVEALILSMIGAGAGVLVARWIVGFVPSLSLPIPGGGTLDAAVDGRVLVFALVLAVLTGLLFGVAPALRSFRTDVAGTLREEGRGTATGRGLALLRGGLVGVQVAVSVVLVVGAGLLARSLANARGVEPGVDTDAVAVLTTNLAQGGVSQEELETVSREVMEAVTAVPGVERAALTTRLPVQPGGSTTTVVEDFEPPTGTGSVELDFAYVSPDYFATMGIRVLEGRGFGPGDRPETPRVVIVNRTAAERFWGGDAVGRRIRPQGAPDAWREVVGVVEDTKVGSFQELPTPQIYFSADQVTLGAFTVVARTTGSPDAILTGMRSALRGVRPSLPVARLMTLEEHFGAALAGPRLGAALVGVFSLLALLLASLGIYAVVAFAVARRSAELGLRAALGAARGRLVGMVVRESLVPVAGGIAAGVGLALLAAPRVEAVLFGVEGADPVTLTAGATLLLAVAAVASWLPARRAARADPVEALRGR